MQNKRNLAELKRYIRAIADEFLSAWDLYQMPLDLNRVLQVLKCQDYSWNLPPNVEGFHLALQDGTFVIVFNTDKPRRRQRFTIAHEVGHVFLRHYRGVDATHVEANIFAAELLVPARLFRKMVKQDKTHNIKALASLFDVSEKVIERRFEDLEPERP